MIDLLGVRINPITKTKFQDWVKDALGQSDIKKVYKINAEFLTRSYDNDDFRKILNQSDLSIVDGVGVQWAAKFNSLPVSRRPLIKWFQIIGQLFYSLVAVIFKPSWVKHPIPETLPGVDCFKSMLEVADKAGAPVFLFGASQKNLELAIKNLIQEFPSVEIVGYCNGYDYDNQTLIDTINRSSAKMLFVALGSPRQEVWISNNISKLSNVRVVVGEGGTIDRVAHPTRLAPRSVNRLGLEWLWRLFFNQSLTTGRGRWKRFWNSVPRFITIVAKEKYRSAEKNQ